MSRFTDALQSVREFVRSPLSISVEQAERQLLQDAPLRDLLELCHAATRAERAEVLNTVAPWIVEIPDAFQASRLAMLCGVLIEWGAESVVAIFPILERLRRELGHVASSQDEAVKAGKALRYLIIPAMTMLCVDVAVRRAVRQDKPFLDLVGIMASHYREVGFLDRLLKFADGEELIVLHPLESKGYRVRLTAVASNYHLFTLLQDALIGDPAAGLLSGPRASRMVLATARGEIPHDRLVSDSAAFHYATHAGAAIAGEATPLSLPVFEGERIILLGPPPAASRTWDSTYFTNLHDALRSKVDVVEILSAGEVEVRMRRLREQFELNPRGITID